MSKATHTNTTRGRCSRSRRLLHQAAATAACAALGGAMFLIASARAEDVAKQPAEAEQQLASIQLHILEIYENLELTTERLQLLELELAVVRRRCAGAEPRPPVWTEPSR
jgi:hypothetical protein